MSVDITKRTIADADDKRVVLTASEIRRKMAMGTTWTKLRIGLRLVVPASETIADNPVFAFGLCTNGARDGFGNTTLNFIGARMSGASFNYTAGPPAYLTASAAGAMLACKRVNGVTTDGSAVSSAATMLVAEPTTNRSCLFLEITKGSPNWTVQLGAPTTAAGVQADISLALFQVQMDWPQWSATSITSWVSGYNIGTARTLAFDETAGAIDTVDVCWKVPSPGLEVCDVAVKKLA